MKHPFHFACRVLLFLVGLFIMSIGVVLSVKADLGTSPVSCVPYVYSLRYAPTIGQFTMIINILLILLQMVILRRKYQWVQLVQLPVVLLFGVFIDICMSLMHGLAPVGYISKLFFCLLSCVVLAAGVFMEVKAKVTYLAGEGVAMAIAQVFKMEFGKSKVLVDSALVVIGIVSSLLLLHTVAGIREGTIIAALLVGIMARFLSSRLAFVDNWLQVPGAPEPAADTQNLVITIAREFGSGGHEIGRRVAEKLGIAFYDSELIALTAEESGFPSDYVKENEQKVANRLLFELFEQNYAYVSDELPPLDVLFMVQSKVIRDLAAKAPCVIVGRAADFVLKGHSSVLNVFIHADPEFRQKRIVEEYGRDAHEAQSAMEHKDRERKNYCRHYTHKAWGSSADYGLTLNSAHLGLDASVALICAAARKRVEP